MILGLGPRGPERSRVRFLEQPLVQPTLWSVSRAAPCRQSGARCGRSLVCTTGRGFHPARVNTGPCGAAPSRNRCAQSARWSGGELRCRPKRLSAVQRNHRGSNMCSRQKCLNHRPPHKRREPTKQVQRPACCSQANGTMRKWSHAGLNRGPYGYWPYVPTSEQLSRNTCAPRRTRQTRWAAAGAQTLHAPDPVH